MSRDPYIVFGIAKGNAIFVVAAWLGAIISPLFILSAFGQFTDFQFYIGIGLAIFPLLAIRYGIRALALNSTSDFVVYALFTIIVFLFAVAHMLFYPVFWFGNNT